MYYKIYKIIVSIALFFTYLLSFASNDDIKWLREPIWLTYFIWIQLLIISLLVWLYFYYSLFVNKKTLVKKTIDLKQEKINSLTTTLKNLKKNSWNYTKSDFYSELNWYFRDYFWILEIQNSDTLTLSDVKKLNLDKNLIILYEKSYLSEFKDSKDLIKTRLEIIDKLINIIK